VTKTAVLGVGNVLMGDDGLGVQAVWALQDRRLPKEIELLDCGTAFQALAGQLAGFHKLIILDAVHGGGPPGTIYRFELEEILCREETGRTPSKSPGALSLHDLGVVEALALERLAEDTSPGGMATSGRSAVVIGMEPAQVEPSIELSPILRREFAKFIQAIVEECTKQEEPS
jgi:hydrogenase maturation protease